MIMCVWVDQKQSVQCFGYISAAILPFVLFDATTKPTKEPLSTTAHIVLLYCKLQMRPYPAHLKTVCLEILLVIQCIFIFVQFWSCSSILGTSISVLTEHWLHLFLDSDHEVTLRPGHPAGVPDSSWAIRSMTFCHVGKHRGCEFDTFVKAVNTTETFQTRLQYNVEALVGCWIDFFVKVMWWNC